MTNEAETDPVLDPRREMTTRFLEWCLRGPDEVIERIADWLDGMDEARLAAALQLPARSKPVRAELLDIPPAVAELRRLKEEYSAAGRRRAGADADPGRERDRRVGAILGYYLVLAAAVVHHGVWIGQASREELRCAFRDLGASLPSPWSELCRRAAAAS